MICQYLPNVSQLFGAASSVADDPKWGSSHLRYLFAQTGEAPGGSPVMSIDCLALTTAHLVTKCMYMWNYVQDIVSLDNVIYLFLKKNIYGFFCYAGKHGVLLGAVNKACGGACVHSFKYRKQSGGSSWMVKWKILAENKQWKFIDGCGWC